MYNALIVNSNAIMCLSLATLLQSEGYTVLGEVRDYSSAIKFENNKSIDLVLIDCEITDMDVFTLAKRYLKNNRKLKILMMGNKKNLFNVRNAISCGVNGFIFTNNSIETMKNAFRSIMAGYSFFPMESGIFQHSGNAVDGSQIHDQLSVREIQLLRQLTSGKKQIHIAEEMKISFKTVSSYKYRIMNKLQLCTTVELLEYARTHGI